MESGFKIGAAFRSPIDVRQKTKELCDELDKDYFRIANEHIKAALEEMDAAGEEENAEFDIYEVINHLTAAYFMINALTNVKIKKRVMLLFNEKHDICEDKLEIYGPCIQLALLVFNMYHFLKDDHEDKWEEYATNNLELYRENIFKRYRCEAFDEETGEMIFEIPNGLYKRLMAVSPDYVREVTVLDREWADDGSEGKQYKCRVITEHGEVYCKKYFSQLEAQVKESLALIRITEFDRDN